MKKVPSGNVYLNPQFLLGKLKVETGMQVGDFGSGGAGYFALQAARLVGEKGRILAIDILKTALSALMTKTKMLGLKNIFPVWSNLEIYNATKTIGKETLDVGMLINVLHQTKKPGEVLKECTRMLKRGGRLLVVDWKKTDLPFAPPTKILVDKARLKEWAHQVGLAEMEDFDAGQYHYGIIFTKSA